MNKRSIYLKSISCKGIKSHIPFQKPSLHAAVSLSATSQRHQTPVDAANGENPEWECRMRFDLPTTPSDGQDLFLEFDLTVQVPLLGDHLVGTSRVPISDLIDSGSSGHVSYQVQWPDGKPNGTIQLWYELEGSKLPRDMAYDYWAEPSAPPAADFSYKPPVEPGPVYPTTIPGSVSLNSQLVNPVPVFYPPMPGLATYNSEPVLPGPGEMHRINATPAGMEYMPYPPPPSSGLYPPPNSGFGSMAPCYPPPKNHNPPMDLAANGSTYYPPPRAPYLPVHHSESGSAYYPPPRTRYPPAFESECCDSECRKADEPVVAYPPPRYPYL